MQKQKLYLIPFFALLGAMPARAEDPETSVREVAVMHARDDGNYDVFCTNGNREVVTNLDLRLNNVCPNLKSSTPTNILSLQRRADGNYDVVCRDFRKLVISEAQLLEGKACLMPSAPKVVLEDGLYQPIRGDMSFYKQQVTVAMQGEILKSVRIRVPDSGWVCKMNCEGTKCKGGAAAGDCVDCDLEILAKDQYRYHGTDGNEAIFGK